MSATTNTKKTTITLTLEPEQKQLLEQAAALRRLTVNEYLLLIALETASEETAEPEVIVASDRDWEIIESAILNSPAANEALKAAINEY
ncbi:MAG: DUF1778 domain-containing protein [Okeania sp. SIO3H1]|uniref:type II toxin-antitoxin system TacA family antitoxin n=1 Tax=Okeania sp. SIO1I7 TaxID=2607772 RepID=UPI0013C97E46|nr:DUF1778 domain-containing protein [Okeania sp. SIO1I7]NEN88646.1 DUF1778 domain-containing protein [Okeania sp. SIO3H1]NET27140.1 DUF1778 domain-containing protein [Okeania sp. SIO1I7]